MFAEIAINTKILNHKNIFTYSIPKDMRRELKEGMLVSVYFKNKLVNGVVVRMHNNQVEFKTLEIQSIIYSFPIISKDQLNLAGHISDTYNTDYMSAIKLFPNFSNPIKPTNRVEFLKDDINFKNITLTEEQQTTLEILLENKEKRFLLHGRTGSGKTELYIRLIASYIKKNKQAILLVPEISLTPQIVHQFIDIFGKENISIHHSKIKSTNKKINPDIPIVIGTRSALFYPLRNLGVIIIDEAHDNSYKQDNNPRYNTIKSAEYISKNQDIQLVLGTATPSIEQYYDALNNEYKLITLKKPIHTNTNINTHIIDLKGEKMVYEYITDELLTKITDRIQNKEQSLIYINRRGIASAVICNSCRQTIKCPHCNIPFTLHKNVLLCHHCNFAIKVPKRCKCGSTLLKPLGVGTENIEYRLKKIFPNTNILRIDTDSIKTETKLDNLYDSLLKENPPIIVGTQMITKGWDIPNITLVGVIFFDTDLLFPDFKANEYAYNILNQVIGRGGRNTKPTDIIIQTNNPNNPVLNMALKGDYKSFYEEEIQKRKWLNYPPYTDLIKITIQDKDLLKCKAQASKINEILKKKKTDEIELLGPIPCFHSYINKQYRMQIIVKTPRNNLDIRKSLLNDILQSKNVTIDCDPINLL